MSEGAPVGDTGGSERSLQRFRELLRKAQAGDRRAMDDVLGELLPRLEPIARRYADPVRPVGSTTDLLQECCLRAWKGIGSFRGGQTDEETFAMFRAWIGRILRNLGRNEVRDQMTRRRRTPGRVHSLGGGAERNAVDDPAAPDPGPRTSAGKGEEARMLRESLERIDDPTNRAIIERHYFHGETLGEIADHLGLSFPEVRRRYRAGMRQLERDLT